VKREGEGRKEGTSEDKGDKGREKRRESEGEAPQFTFMATPLVLHTVF